MSIRVHDTAEVSDKTTIGDGTSIWHQAQVRDGVKIGKNCIIGKGAYLDAGVKIGDNVKIQNYVSIYHGVIIEDGVFVGPHVCFTNDLRPRAVTPNGTLKDEEDWKISNTTIKKGAALGANSTIRCGITIGKWAMVGAGSVITHDVPDHGKAWGNPARLRGFVCKCGSDLTIESHKGDKEYVNCPQCGEIIKIPLTNWEKIHD